MKSTEIRALQLDEIQGKIIDNKTLLSKLRFAHSMSPIENPKRISLIRRTIARLKTELKNRELTPDQAE